MKREGSNVKVKLLLDPVFFIFCASQNSDAWAHSHHSHTVPISEDCYGELFTCWEGGRGNWLSADGRASVKLSAWRG